jgi:hypothetical protein
MNTAWQLPPSALLEDDAALTATVERIYDRLYEQLFQHDLVINHALPIETRAARRVGDWRVFLLLTPWMLARTLVPGTPPALTFPSEWQRSERAGADAVVLGPLLQFSLLDTAQKAHLNYDAVLGHYLLQPLVLAMEPFRDAGEVFSAWNDVIRTRDENMRKMERECRWQQEVSRREFFRGMVPKS